MTQNFQQQFERRTATLNGESQEFWTGIAKKYGFDRTKLLYIASPDASALVLQQIRVV